MPRTALERGLRNEVRRHAKTYAGGREREAALAPYETSAAVLAAVEGRGAPDRLLVLAAITREQRRAAHPLWQALLLIAFEPMLAALRLRQGRPGSDDLDQEVVLAFLDTVRAVDATSIDGYLVFALRRETTRLFYRRRGLPEPTEAFDEEIHVRPEEHEPRHGALLAAALAESGPDLAPALVATYGGDESLRSYVERSYSELPHAEREAAYQRLGRQRRDLLDRLREHVRTER